VPIANKAHAILPLSLFEAVRDLDVPPGADLDEFHRELVVKRLGTSATVAAQIERYAHLAQAGKRVDAEDFIAVLRLIGRRSDADLVFANGGRLAGRHAVRLTSPAARALRKLLDRRGREQAGFRLARRAARRAFHADLSRSAAVTEVVLPESLATIATPDGAACGFYGSAVAELLRTFTTFDGALFHTQCRSRGDPVCRWRSKARQEE
jgi:hypothetical protein